MTTPMRLLVVEDDQAIRALIGATVPDEWVVFEAADGMEALAVARREQPDAMIVDHDLPLLTGAEVCRVLRQEAWAAECRMVGLTANAAGSVRTAFAEAGVDAFINKPFSPMQLLDLLDTWESSRA